MSEVDLITDNLRRQCEALVLEREAALARLERVRAYANYLRCAPAYGDYGRARTEVVEELNEILDH